MTKAIFIIFNDLLFHMYLIIPISVASNAKHKVCFLRADTGPCRADIVQWYYDVKEKKCFRFFWGGCQGNGNKFETQNECYDHCYLNSSAPTHIPLFCGLGFDYGSCFGRYYRWGWDPSEKTCKRRLYSGCGGNQNNFETRKDCMGTCFKPPSDTLQRDQEKHETTCFPINNLNSLL